MTKNQVKELKCGVYRLYWASGGYSLASIGVLHDGTKWFACSNWTSKHGEGILTIDDMYWKLIVSAKLIESK